MPLMEDLYAKQRARQVELVPFFYSAQFLNSLVAAGATVPVNVSINSDAHFVVRYLNITAYAAGLVVFTGMPALTINLLDTGSGRVLQDQPQAIQNLCGGVAANGGSGSLPFIFPEPWLIKAGGAAVVTIGNIGAVTFPRVDVSLVGVKVYQFGAAMPGQI